MLWLLGLALAPMPEGRACMAAEIAELTGPADTPYDLTCQATLVQGQSITRRIIMRGEGASNSGIDCQGGSIGRADVPSTTSAPTVAIWSSKQADGSWSAPQGLSVRNCTVHGAIRIWGMGSDGSYDDLRATSRTAGHTERLQQAAPRSIRLENLSLIGNGSIPLYVGPGVTDVTLTGSTLTGRSTATAIYLDAESARTTLTGNRIATRTGREVIAIDGSARNVIRNNRLELNRQPGIFLYRNCGERGVIRHQTPSDNIITDNHFTKTAWLVPRLVVENARNGRRSYCGDDAGYPFGSSVDDRDNASGNRISNNRR